MLENVYEGLNARKCKGRSNQKIQKTKSIFFGILLLGGPSPPSQLVPNPFNWSPKSVFLQISQHRSLKSKKLKKLSPFIFKFCFWKDPPHPQKCI